MNILLTGATGFVGSHAVRFLSQKHRCVCLVRQPGWLSSLPNVTPLTLDLNDEKGWDRLPSDIDVIVHLAQYRDTRPDPTRSLLEVNVTATHRLAEYARKNNVQRFVLASSGSVYQPSAEPFVETHPVGAANFYSWTKLAAEALLPVYASNFDTCVLRLFAPYGPGQTNRMIPKLLERVQKDEVVSLTNEGEPRINPLYIDDAVQMLEQALSLKGHHVVNAAGPTVVSVKDIAEIAGQVLKRQPRFEHKTSPQHANLIADTKKMNATFQLKNPVSPHDGIRRMIEAAGKN